MKPVYREVRACFNVDTIRVYQAFPNNIADTALEYGNFVCPPFKMNRMTWIKPSFLWMMYRSGWGFKDENQSRILAIDILRTGFDWALHHSCLSHYENDFYSSKEQWQHIKNNSPVRIQWDPERNLLLEPLNHRAIQVGLSNNAVELYLKKWIINISDITDIAHTAHKLILENKVEKANSLLPIEKKYPINNMLEKKIGIKINSSL